VVHQIKTIKLIELNFIFKENALFERKSKAKNKFFLTFDLNYANTWPLPTFTASLFWESRLSNDIWYRCVAHGFITFYFLIFYRWSIIFTSYKNLTLSKLKFYMIEIFMKEWLKYLQINFYSKTSKFYHAKIICIGTIL
jgi:hypothetical protein